MVDCLWGGRAVGASHVSAFSGESADEGAGPWCVRRGQNSGGRGLDVVDCLWGCL